MGILVRLAFRKNFHRLAVRGLWGIHPDRPEIIVLFEPDDRTFVAYTISDLQEILDRVVALGLDIYKFDAELNNVVSAKFERIPRSS